MKVNISMLIRLIGGMELGSVSGGVVRSRRPILRRQFPSFDHFQSLVIFDQMVPCHCRTFAIALQVRLLLLLLMLLMVLLMMLLLLLWVSLLSLFQFSVGRCFVHFISRFAWKLRIGIRFRL